jgi:hypothetical protein
MEDIGGAASVGKIPKRLVFSGDPGWMGTIEWNFKA